MTGQFSEVGNFVARGAGKVNPALIDILKEAAARTGMQVEAYSGYRPGDPRFHGKGEATDIRIIGPDGKPLPNYQTPATFQTYEQLAQAARQVQQEKYPELADQFRWGGYFGGGKGKYGSMDLMHFDLGGGNGLGMAGGSWDKGLTDKQAALYQMANHKPQGLENLTVPADQRSTALALASQGATSPAVGAVNKLAQGEPANPVQSVNYVPPPFSGQQANFQPLLGDQQPAPQASAPAAPQAASVPPVAAPDADPLAAFGIKLDDNAVAPQPQAPASQEVDPLKAFGINLDDAAAAEPAAAVAATPAESSGSIGQTIGGAIDKGIGLADKYGSPVVSMGNNLIRQVGTGVPIIGGALNSMDAATNAAIAPAINPLLPDSWKLQGGTFGERYQNSLNQQNGQDQQFQAAHPVLSTGAQLAGGIGAMGGAAAAFPALGTALGMSGSIGARTALGAASGAVIGGGDAGVRSGGDPEAIKRGAATGLLFGGAMPIAGKAIGAGVNKLIGGGSVPQRVAQLAQLAKNKFGIDIGPGQLSTNPTIKFLDSVVNRLPFSGGTAAKEAQQTAFNSAVANSFGETAKAVTPEVIDAAKSRIGSVFDSVATRTPTIKADGQLQTDILKIYNEAQQTLQPSEVTPLRNQLLALVKQYKDGGNAIDGKTYQAITRKGAPLDRLINSADPNVSYSASQIREAIDGTLERSAPADVLSDLRTARSQWKALKTVEPLATKSTTGDISPALLMTQAAKSYGNAAYGKGADLVDLGRIGQQFLKEAPSSGTAERSMLLNNPLLSGAGAWGLATNPAAIPYAIGGAVASGIASRGLGTVLRSPYLGNKMVQNALGTGAPDLGNYLLRSVPQGVAVPQVNQRQPLELTVRPNKLLQQ
ncbi:hypothetical protein [Mesorhizobium sp. NZP2077]|uniref:hypothetical protein n=1 Tax=Mesorhizobium sp. NZP2077 TaxID=2483404 RepID=UPI0015521E34|nr:hypothetical protein [Mesorhizobium sp. NZP2077]QKC81527.1 hypothetical protein EB232_07595 [Mesorhizobium sp. NZP2077]QKD14977.1 hypothetical protein HGP13_07490 [Mesorhizobium sp. NZP2077]